MSRNGASWIQNQFVDAVMDNEEDKQVIELGWDRNKSWAEVSPCSKDDTVSFDDSCAPDYEEERGTWPEETACFATEDEPDLHLNPLHGAASDYQYMEFGRPGTLHYRMLFLDDTGKEVSPWHSIPLHGRDGLLAFICKSPKGTWAEYEVAEHEEYNPLRMRNRRGSPSHFAENTSWNVGFLPETYGDPDQLNEEHGGLAFDGKPLEVFDVGSRAGLCGDVYLVKPLAAFAVIEDQRLSWKLVAIAAGDVLADRIHSVEDLQAVLPGALENLRNWLRTYHCLEPEDKEIVFGLDDQPVGLDVLLQVVAGAHGAWQLYSTDHPARGGDRRSPLGRDAEAYEKLWRKYTDGLSIDCTDLSESRATSTLKYERAWSSLSDTDGVAGVGPEHISLDNSSSSPPLDGGVRAGRGKGKELLSFLTHTSARKAGEQMMSKLRVGQRRREVRRSSGSVDGMVDREALANEAEGQHGQPKKYNFRGLMPKLRTAQPEQNPNPQPSDEAQEFLAPGGYRMDKATFKALTLQGTAVVAGKEGGWTGGKEGDRFSRTHSSTIPTSSSEIDLSRMLSMGHSPTRTTGWRGGTGRASKAPFLTESAHWREKGRLGRWSADNLDFTAEEDGTSSAILPLPRVSGTLRSQKGSISVPSPSGGGRRPTQQELADLALPRFENPAPHQSFPEQPPISILKSKAPAPFANLSVQVEDPAGQEVEAVRGEVAENEEEGADGGGGRVGGRSGGTVKASPVIEGVLRSSYNPRTTGLMGQKVEGGGSRPGSGNNFASPIGGGAGGYELPKMGSSWVISATPTVARMGLGLGHDSVGEGAALEAEAEEEVADRQDGEWKGGVGAEEEEVELGEDAEEGDDIPVAKAIGMYVRGWDEDGVGWEGGKEGALEHEPLKKMGRRVSFADRNQVITFMPVREVDREVEAMSGL